MNNASLPTPTEITDDLFYYLYYPFKRNSDNKTKTVKIVTDICLRHFRLIWTTRKFCWKGDCFQKKSSKSFPPYKAWMCNKLISGENKS